MLDDKLVKEAMKLSGKHTKREVVDFALHELINYYRRLEIRNFRGKLKWEGNLDEMKAMH